MKSTECKKQVRKRRENVVYIIIAFFMWGTVFGCGRADENRIIDADNPLSSIIECSSTDFNMQLAKIAAELSDVSEKTSDSEIRKAYRTYGIGSMKTYNYDTSILGGGAFVIGTANIQIENDIYTVLVITARGSTTTAELVGNQRWLEEITFWRKKDYIGYKVWDNVLEFEEKMLDGLNSYVSTYSDLKRVDNLKVLITGHSLGGAAANLFTARITNGIGGSD